jgi:tRNA A37 threonylcarbamoyladenosine dehydratase
MTFNVKNTSCQVCIGSYIKMKFRRGGIKYFSIRSGSGKWQGHIQRVGNKVTAENPAFHRLEILTGSQGLSRLRDTRVIVFGIGGVGSWAAEALVRSGIGAVTLVDSDVICVTNINRQVQATSQTVGRSKVAELATRLMQINPDATIVPLQKIYHRSTADQFDLAHYPYVVDAIDSISNKVDLIIAAHAAGAKVFSALGASNKLDPAKIRVASLWESQGCPLGRYLRKRLRRKGFAGEVTCVYSEENLPLAKADLTCGKAGCLCPKTSWEQDGEFESAPADASLGAPKEWCSSKKQINGSAVHITGTFGFYLAGLVIQDVLARP